MLVFGFVTVVMLFAWRGRRVRQIAIARTSGRSLALAARDRGSTSSPSTSWTGSPASSIPGEQTLSINYNQNQILRSRSAAEGIFGQGLFQGTTDEPGVRAVADDRLHLHRGRGATRIHRVEPSVIAASHALLVLANAHDRGGRARPIRSTGGGRRRRQMIAFHVFVNIGMTVGLLPGDRVCRCPFMSYGGSFYLSMMLVARRRSATRSGSTAAACPSGSRPEPVGIAKSIARRSQWPMASCLTF